MIQGRCPEVDPPDPEAAAPMLVLTFRIAEIPYGVAVGRVVEVVPRVALRELPHAPAHLAGLLRYRGDAVPVVDLGLLMGGAACPGRLDTRIILVDAGGGRRLGLVAERVEDVLAVDEGRRAAGGAEVRAAPYLGDVYETVDGLVQLIEPSRVPTGPAAIEPAGASA